jgi:tRNA-dihydrouridine synthase
MLDRRFAVAPMMDWTDRRKKCPRINGFIDLVTAM